MLITCQLRDVPPVDPEGMAFRQLPTEVTLSHPAGADPGFFAGGGGSTTAVYCGSLRRPRRRGGLGLINIKLRYIASIEYSERFLLLFFLL